MTLNNLQYFGVFFLKNIFFLSSWVLIKMATASNGGGSVSLESGIRTCKVVTGWANKVQSDRFQNPNLMVCPVWNGLDAAGRQACPDSFMTKRAGCNSAQDRVVVENNVSRPQYMEYVNLDASGIAADIYAGSAPHQASLARTNDLKGMLPSDKHPGVTATWGNGGGYGAQTLRGCSGMGSHGQSVYDKTHPVAHTAENYAMAQQHQQQRHIASMQNGYRSSCARNASGF
tara:strand:- start:7566 stop:8255 length:690 start_codon:yes stop_codon:yes gene_type:complete